MRIIRNYFLKEFFHNFFLSLLGITLIMLLGNLIKFSDMVIRKGVNVGLAFKLFVYYVPYLLEFSLPLACLLGCLLSLGRIVSDNELVAVKVAGIAFSKILMSFLTVGLIVSLFLVILNDRIIPQAHFIVRKTLKKISKEDPLAFIEPQVFINKFKDFMLFVSDIEGNRARKVFLYELGNRTSNLIFAKYAEFVVDDKTLKIKLKDGFIEGPRGKSRIYFTTQFIHLPIEKENIPAEKKPKDMSIKELISKIDELKKNIDPIPLRIELHKKISLSFASFIFILLGSGLGVKVRHREKFINFGICLFVALSYYLLLLLGEALVSWRLLPVALGMWFPNLVFLILGFYFSYRICVL